MQSIKKIKLQAEIHEVVTGSGSSQHVSSKVFRCYTCLFKLIINEFTISSLPVGFGISLLQLKEYRVADY
jgi:hypothetical protein